MPDFVLWDHGTSHNHINTFGGSEGRREALRNHAELSLAILISQPLLRFTHTRKKVVIECLKIVMA